MLQELLSWPEKLSIGAKLAQELTYPSSPGTLKNIAFIGMGGSGIAGRLLKTMLDKNSSINSHIIDGPELPNFIDTSYTAIVVSYSGNTWETVCALQEVIVKKIPVIILCHGGILLDLAQKHQLPFALIPNCKAPRAALGYMLGFLYQFFENHKILAGKAMLSKFATLLANKLQTLTDEQQYQTLITAVQGYDHFHIWGISGDTTAVAYRAQTQFNENSKIQAVFSSFPELNHNLMVGLTAWTQAPLILLFSSSFLSKELQASKKSAEQILQGLGVTLYKCPIFGDTWEEQLLMMIVWADFASYYLGKARGVDILSTKVIDQLKANYLNNVQIS